MPSHHFAVTHRGGDPVHSKHGKDLQDNPKSEFPQTRLDRIFFRVMDKDFGPGWVRVIFIGVSHIFFRRIS